MQRARALSRDEPFIPIVRALADQPLDSPACFAAVEAASEDEVAFAAEIVALRQRRLIERQSDIDAELIEIEPGY